MADASCIKAIEAAASRAWPTAETESLGGWVLRCGRAGSRRLNSVQTLAFEDGADLDAAIAAAEGWYRSRGLPPCFQLNDAVQPRALDAELHRRGYEIITPTSVMIARDPPAPVVDQGIALSSHADDRVVQAIFDSSWKTPVRLERLEVFARIAAPHRFALVVVGGVPVAGGMCVADGGLAGLFSMRTQPAHRGRGLARAVAQRLMSWAREQQAGQVYLQVEDHNAAALSLYRGLGFERVYGYHYREKAADASTGPT